MNKNFRQTELAWAAGFLDGEGYFGCRPREGRFRLIVQGGQSGDYGREILVRLRGAVWGLGRIYGPYLQRKSPKPIYRYSVEGAPAQQVIALVWPYLSGAKKAQATHALADWKRAGQVLRQKSAKYLRELSQDIKLHKELNNE